MKTEYVSEEETWKDYRPLCSGDIQKQGDVRSSKAEYTHREDIPASHHGSPVPMPSDTDFNYYRPKSSRDPIEHKLKCWTDPYFALTYDSKKFEFRKNDRDFQPGDILHLGWYSEPRREGDTGHDFSATSTETRTAGYIAYGPAFGIPEGYCVISLLPEFFGPLKIRKGWQS